MVAQTKFNLDSSQFRVRFIFDVFHPVGSAILIASVTQVALNLVQHGVNPRGGGVVFVLLDELMRGIPFASQSQFHRLEQIIVRRAHGVCFTAEPARLQDDECLMEHKFWPHVGRVDNVFGNRNPVCSCVGTENHS